VALDGKDAAGDPAHHRGGIARARADLEHAVARTELRRLNHQRHDVGLRDRLPCCDRQCAVLIGELLEALLNKTFTRHAPHRIENVPIAHATAFDLHAHHAVAGRVTRNIQHGSRRPPPGNAPLKRSQARVGHP
jgi:hypothetical protein